VNSGFGLGTASLLAPRLPLHSYSRQVAWSCAASLITTGT
jgi:hypothetical protein